MRYILIMLVLLSFGNANAGILDVFKKEKKVPYNCACIRGDSMAYCFNASNKASCRASCAAKQSEGVDRWKFDEEAACYRYER